VGRSSAVVRRPGARRVGGGDAVGPEQRSRPADPSHEGRLPNTTVVPIADAERCCGSAGIYNLTHPEVAGELQRQKVAAILAARPDVVVSANPGCILQVQAGLRAAGSDIPVLHLMRFLDDPSASLGAFRE